MVEAYSRGEKPDPADGRRAKQRSVHNTYFTLPVLFVMTSNHYAMTYGHDYNWLILVAITLAGALIRVYFVARQSGRRSPLPIVFAALLLLATAAATAPKSRTSMMEAVTLDRIRPIIDRHCRVCHSATPTHIAFPAAPSGVTFDSDAQILTEAARIHQQTVVLRSMPIGNVTQMQAEERQLIDAWYVSTDE
jgi:uncharacterized membrane protein